MKIEKVLSKVVLTAKKEHNSKLRITGKFLFFVLRNFEPLDFCILFFFLSDFQHLTKKKFVVKVKKVKRMGKI